MFNRLWGTALVFSELAVWEEQGRKTTKITRGYDIGTEKNSAVVVLKKGRPDGGTGV